MKTIHKALLTFSLIAITAAPLNHAHAFFDKKEKPAADQSTQSQPIIQSRPGSFADLAEILLPTVVNISSTAKITPADEM